MVPLVAIENIILAAVTVFALALTAIAVVAWRRTRDVHLIFLTGAFGVYFAKGLVLTLVVFLVSPPPLAQLFILSGSFDLVVLALFYGFTLRR